MIPRLIILACGKGLFYNLEISDWLVKTSENGYTFWGGKGVPDIELYPFFPFPPLSIAPILPCPTPPLLRHNRTRLYVSLQAQIKYMGFFRVWFRWIFFFFGWENICTRLLLKKILLWGRFFFAFDWILIWPKGNRRCVLFVFWTL